MPPSKLRTDHRGVGAALRAPFSAIVVAVTTSRASRSLVGAQRTALASKLASGRVGSFFWRLVGLGEAVGELKGEPTGESVMSPSAERASIMSAAVASL